MNACIVFKRPTVRYICSWTFEWYDKPSDMVVKRHINWGDPTVYKMTKDKARDLWKTLMDDGYEASPIMTTENQTNLLESS